MTQAILNIAVPYNLRRLFDYSLGTNTKSNHPVGARVKIPFRNREAIGYIMGKSNQTDCPQDKLKAAIEILDQTSLFTPTVMALCQWATDYYQCPVGEVLSAALPTLLRKGREIDLTEAKPHDQSSLINTAPHYPLNEEQLTAINSISKHLNTFKPFLLQGITGSGKTEVYLQIIEKVISEGKQCLVLVPEIGLTPQTITRFEQRFTVPIALFHSNLTDKQRLDQWCKVKTGEAAIIIGTRSAIFSPMINPGLIIIDEEHDGSYKQQDTFRYSARDCAIIRGKLENIPVILGSATPSLESLYNADRGRYKRLTLTQRAGDAIPPKMYCLDMRNKRQDHGLSAQLQTKMQQHLEQGGQVLLFINRRGYAPSVICKGCGWVAKCAHCDANMTLHQSPPYLQCHHCAATRRVDRQCPSCSETELAPVGQGTERLEEGLNHLFPHYNVLRIDRDSTRKKGAMAKMLEDIHQNRYQILVGTQMIAKGHHFPNITLVGILAADAGLFATDFRGIEHLGQQIMQVSGRAGRADKPGEVVIQTYNPDHPHLQCLLKAGYNTFAKTLLKERQEASLPPYAHMAIFRAESKNKQQALDFLEQVKKLGQQQTQPLHLLGPVPAPMEKRAGKYRYQLIAQHPHRSTLQATLPALITAIEKTRQPHTLRWSIDVDPQELY